MGIWPVYTGPAFDAPFACHGRDLLWWVNRVYSLACDFVSEVHHLLVQSDLLHLHSSCGTWYLLVPHSDKCYVHNTNLQCRDLETQRFQRQHTQQHTESCTWRPPLYHTCKSGWFSSGYRSESSPCFRFNRRWEMCYSVGVKNGHWARLSSGERCFWQLPSNRFNALPKWTGDRSGRCCILCFWRPNKSIREHILQHGFLSIYVVSSSDSLNSFAHLYGSCYYNQGRGCRVSCFNHLASRFSLSCRGSGSIYSLLCVSGQLSSSHLKVFTSVTNPKKFTA